MDMDIDVEKPKWLTQTEGILETLNEGVIIINECHRILFVNSGFVEMTGKTWEDVTDKVVSELYSANEWEFCSGAGRHCLPVWPQSLWLCLAAKRRRPVAGINRGSSVGRTRRPEA
jgi:PAS domain-containing protein